jgi:HD-GYP domain-containing protein (c-di-GMP phosphodiesterase class II)
MTGLDLAATLLELHPGQPIVLMTGDPGEALAREALSRGPVGYLLKPFALEALEAAVEQAVAKQLPAPASLPEADSPGRVPLQWLDVVDARSYAGKGHARRVARIAMALVETARTVEERLQVGDLVVAGWSHELGRLRIEDSDPVKLAVAGAEMLLELGCSAGVVEGVRHMHERYDGTGGPARQKAEAIPAISQVLAVADSLEHYAAAWVHAGREAGEAMERSLGLMRVQRGTVFSPEVVDAAMRQRHRIVGIYVEAHEVVQGDVRNDAEVA